MSDPLYVLHPGYVRSRNDGDRHFIDAIRLRRLYAIPPTATCVLGKSGQDYPADAIHCSPRYDGNYPAMRKHEVRP